MNETIGRWPSGALPLWLVLLTLCLIALPTSVAPWQWSAATKSATADSELLDFSALRPVAACLQRPFQQHFDKRAFLTHYDDIQRLTQQYRNVTIHRATGHEGLWVENHFIASFLSRPALAFGGLIPLFVQWSDYQFLHRRHPRDYSMFAALKHALRPQYTYVAVSQANSGLLLFEGAPNVLVFSAGGNGHVAIPLVKGNLPRQPPQPAAYDLSFFGSVNHGPRRAVIAAVAREARRLRPPLRWAANRTHDWVQEMARSAFSLAPVGHGRGTFRLSEVIQLGRVPVYVYVDRPWIPYEGSNVSVESIGLVAPLSRVSDTLRQLARVNESALRSMEARVALAAPHYTYAGVLRQLALFFERPFDPQRGGYLRCSAFRWVPDSATAAVL